MYRKQVRRRRAVLALLVVSSFALLTVTYGDRSGALQRSVGTVFGPLEEGADRALKPATDLVNWFDETFEARGENERLHQALEEARRDAVAGEAALAENEELRKIVELNRSGVIPTGYEPVVGQVIAKSPSVWWSTVTVDKGSSAGVKVNDPVITGDGLVGRVSSVTRGNSQVTLITDHTSAVSGKVVPAGVSGVIKPEIGDPDRLVLDFIDSDQVVREGQRVVTAGWRSIDEDLSSLFPPNLPVGEVTEATIAEQEASQQVHLRPFADIREIDHVEILTGGSRNQ